jgi:uncharacterized protein (DUF2141 family)
VKRSAFLFFGMSLVAAPHVHAAELVVHVDRIVSDRGTIRVAVDHSESSYRDDSKAFRRARTPARAPQVAVTFADIPPGRYAIRVYQDENGDGWLNRNLFGVPTEPYGFSNNPPARFSMPSFDQVLIEVNQPRAEARIELSVPRE